MKKGLTMLLASVFAVSLLAGCGKTTPTSNDKPNTSKSNIVKIGLGHVTSIASSKDLGVDKDGKEVLPVGQVDTVIAAVAFDKDGKVVKVTIDNAQTKVNFAKDMKLTSDPKAEQKTKVELKDEYGMIKASTIKKEWYQQAAELEKWMVGKSIDEIKSMKTMKKDDAHPSVPDVAELKSLVSISVQDYIAAVEEASKNAVEVNGAVEKLGLGHNVSIASSKALGVDKDGKVVRTLIDNAQTKINFSKDGKVTSDKKAEYKTKVELKDAYGMIKASTIKKEWYQQAAELEKWMAGKSISDIKSMKTMKKDDAHPSVPDVAELKSLVSISVQDYIAAVEESFKNAK